MFNRQFNLLVMISLLLSPDLVHANGMDGDRNVSVGNVQIHTTKNGTVLQTPKIQVSTPKATGKALTSRTRRTRTAVIRPKRQVIISNPAVILPERVGTSAPPVIIINTPTSNPTIPASTISTPTTTPTVRRSTTIRTSTNGSGSVSTQQQSIQCNSDDEGSSSVSQSTSTVNGRTVRSQTRTNCR
jgi:hypothetical protein